MQELKKKNQYPEEKYTMTIYTIEFSPTPDGASQYIELLHIDDQDPAGWKIDVIGSKQVFCMLYLITILAYMRPSWHRLWKPRSLSKVT